MALICPEFVQNNVTVKTEKNHNLMIVKFNFGYVYRFPVPLSIRSQIF